MPKGKRNAFASQHLRLKGELAETPRLRAEPPWRESPPNFGRPLIVVCRFVPPFQKILANLLNLIVRLVGFGRLVGLAPFYVV